MLYHKNIISNVYYLAFHVLSCNPGLEVKGMHIFTDYSHPSAQSSPKKKWKKEKIWVVGNLASTWTKQTHGNSRIKDGAKPLRWHKFKYQSSILNAGKHLFPKRSGIRMVWNFRLSSTFLRCTCAEWDLLTLGSKHKIQLHFICTF